MTTTPSSPSEARNPKLVWDNLLAGNARFAAGKPLHPNQSVNRREELRIGQSPRAAVFTCGDSRVPVELLFDVGLGDIFTIRTAGEVVDAAVLASLEFAVEALDVEVLVVLGHESCGAVKAAAAVALDGAEVPTGHQRTIVEQIMPSILSAKSAGKHTPFDFERAHAEAIRSKIMGISPVIKEAVKSGKTAFIAAHYSLADGSIDYLSVEGV